MPKLNNLDKTLRAANKVANNAAAISAVVGLASAAITFVANMIDERNRDKIDISACDTKKHLKTTEEVKEYLEKVEVKAVYIPIKVSEADPKYRDCFEFQVVDITPSGKIIRGDVPQVYYVTHEVIDKSRQLFEEAEQQRMTTKLEKQKKRYEQKEKAKQVASGMIGSMQESVKKIPSVFHKTDKREDCDE